MYCILYKFSSSFLSVLKICCVYLCCYSQLAHECVSLQTGCQSEHSAVVLGMSVCFLWHGQHVLTLPWRGLLGLAVCLWGISHLGRTRDFDLLLAWRPVVASMGSRSFFFFFPGTFSLLRIIQKEFEKNFRMMCVVPCLQHCLFSIRDEKSRFCTYFKLITFLIAWLLLSLVLKENYYFYRSFCRFSNSVLMTKNKDRQTPFFVMHQLVCRWWISFMSLMLTLGLVT